MQLDGAASLVIIDSSATHCFVRQSAILNSWAIFEGSELKVQLTMGHEFCTKNQCLLPITFGSGVEHIVDCYVVDKLTMPIVLGMQWL